MATRILSIKTDDLTGEESDGIRTINFTIDGSNFEIDLSEASLEKFTQALEPFTSVARKVSGGKGRKTTAGSNEAKAARIWLKENGHEVGDRGRLTAEQMDIYQQNK